jgi:hypothetical protein
MDPVEWSLAVEAGLHRPPLIRVNGKRPFDDDWPTGPFEQPDRWRTSLAGYDGNVGLVCGRGFGVLDVDRYKPGAENALDALVEEFGLILDTVTVETGRGGLHLYYHYPAGLYVPSAALGRRGFPGIEVKADGGMVVFPPSTHPDTGREYVFLYDCGIGEAHVAPFTTAFLEFVGARRADGHTTSRRWHPLTGEELAQLDPRDVEAARLLVDHFDGHSPRRNHDGTIGVYRPGKTDGSASMSIGYVGPGVARCWTDHWHPFEQHTNYNLGQLKELAGLAPKIAVPDAGPQLPDGYRLWRDTDGLVPAPVLDRVAYHGLIGDYLEVIAGRSEAPAATVGAYLIPCIGTLFGRTVAYAAPPHIHYPKLYVAVVGPTSSGAKDVSRTVAMVLIKAIEPAFLRIHSLAGLGSGERLIHEVRDIDPDQKTEQKPVEKRRIVLDAELSAVLRIVRREGSILGDHLRQAFDNDPLRHSTITNKTTVAADHHISLIGGITPRELAALVDEIAIFNGFLNRYLFVWSELSELHPFGGHIPTDAVTELAARFEQTRRALARDISVNATHRVLTVDDEDARVLWKSFYLDRREGSGDSDLMKAITGRQVPQAARIALVYAALDNATSIGAHHLRAAFAWCDYSTGSIKRIFTTGPAGKAGQLLTAIRDKAGDGLDGVGQYEVFQRHVTADDLAVLRAQLESERLIVTHTVPTAGRNRQVSFAIWKAHQ